MASVPANKRAVTCENCSLDSICIPKGLSQAEVESLGQMVNRNTIRHKGEALYHAGSEFKGIIALRSGSAKLLGLDRDGNEIVVDFMLPGELLGFDGLSTQFQTCTAIALETVNYCRLPTQQIDLLVHTMPSLSQILLQRSGEQFDAQIQRMMLMRRTAEERVACFIVQISERLKARGYAELEFRFSMSREDMGSYLCIAHETVSRIMHHFQSLGLIEVKARQLKIINKKGLLALITE